MFRFTESDDIQVEGGLISERFISHSELNYSAGMQFLMNDTLYFRVTASLGHSKFMSKIHLLIDLVRTRIFYSNCILI